MPAGPQASAPSRWPFAILISLQSTFQRGRSGPLSSSDCLRHLSGQRRDTRYPAPKCSWGGVPWGDVTPPPLSFPQSAFSQLRLTPGLRKVLFATALGTVALALAAHQLKRRRRRKKQVGPEVGGEQLGTVPLPILMARKVPSVKKGEHTVGKH